VVTGGARGLGAWIARALAEAGAEVIVTSRSSETREKIETLADERGLSIRAISGRVDTEDGCREIAEQISDRWDGIDILVNNAGENNSYDALETYAYDIWSRSFSTNATSVFEMTRLMLPLLGARASEESPGRVIVIGSIDGARPSDLSSFAYGASKAASHLIGRALAKHLVRQHINVNTLTLGMFRTSMLVEAIPQIRSQIGLTLRPDDATPVGAVGGYADIAGAILMLAGPTGRYITGESITIDGGLTTLR